MIKKNIVSKMLEIVVFLACIFSPLISILGSSKSYVDLLFTGENAGFLCIFWLGLFFSIFAIVLPNFKICKVISVVLSCLSFLILCMLIKIEKLNLNISSSSFNLEAGYFAYFLLLLYLIFSRIKGSFSDFSITLKDLVEIAIFIALAMVFDLSFFKLRVGQNGGSISIAMLPLFVICLRKGFIKGFIACGVIYGLFNCLLDGYGFISFPFDYLLGFGSLAIVGLFRKYIFGSKKVWFRIMFLLISCVIALTARLMFATISGMLFYGLKFVPSLVYQIAYILPSGGICIALLIVLLKPLSLLNEKTR